MFVVICFQICTFEPLETAIISVLMLHVLLWFAFKFVPLNHWKQRRSAYFTLFTCCDLLSNLYLWTIGNSRVRGQHGSVMLWFAFKFVPLNHWKQHFWRNSAWRRGCDLLSNLYLWTIGNSSLMPGQRRPAVVICFQICTFEPLETANGRYYGSIQ